MSDTNHSTLAAARPDFAAIAAWIPEGASVLDLGCGDGSLLRYLKDERNIRGYGVEISDEGIEACILNGVNVIQSGGILALFQPAFLLAQLAFARFHFTTEFVALLKEFILGAKIGFLVKILGFLAGLGDDVLALC